MRLLTLAPQADGCASTNPLGEAHPGKTTNQTVRQRSKESKFEILGYTKRYGFPDLKETLACSKVES